MIQPRRRQSERTAETRRRLVDAAIECLLRSGISGATVSEICRGAEVTTGALQHQFGSKAGLMAAVVDTLFSPFSDAHEALGQAAPLATRVERLVGHHWRIYSDERYFAVLEALLATRHDPELRRLVLKYRRTQLETLAAYLRAEFPDVPLAVPAMVAAVHRVIDLMRGYTIHRMFDRSEELDQQVQDEARTMLLRAFGQASAEARTRGRGGQYGA